MEAWRETEISTSYVTTNDKQRAELLGCQTFPSKRFEFVKDMMEWRIAIRVIEVNYYQFVIPTMDVDPVPVIVSDHEISDTFIGSGSGDNGGNANVIEMERKWNEMSKDELIALLKRVSNDEDGQRLLMTEMQMSK